MEPRRVEPAHETVRELLGAYALGVVDPDERRLIESHLAGCSLCSAEVAELLAATSALPLLAAERAPGAGLRDRIIAQTEGVGGGPVGPAGDGAALVRVEPVVPPPPIPLNLAPLPRRHHLPRPITIWAAAAILLLAFSAAMVVWNLNLHQSLDNRAQPTQAVAVQFAGPANGAQASLIYLPTQQVMLLNVRNMPPLPNGQVYQAWLIDAGGPVPVGVFHPGDAQLAIAANPASYQTLAVTTEPGPLGSPKPTGAQVIVAPLAGHPV